MGSRYWAPGLENQNEQLPDLSESDRKTLEQFLKGKDRQACELYSERARRFGVENVVREIISGEVRESNRERTLGLVKELLARFDADDPPTPAELIEQVSMSRGDIEYFAALHALWHGLVNFVRIESGECPLQQSDYYLEPRKSDVGYRYLMHYYAPASSSERRLP